MNANIRLILWNTLSAVLLPSSLSHTSQRQIKHWMRALVILERSTWRLIVAFSKEQPAQLMHPQILSQVTRFKLRKKFKVVNAVR
jgi:hypothetical protein